jgi:hypothetical protein
MVDGVIAERFADLRVEDVEGRDQNDGNGAILAAFSEGAEDAVAVDAWHHHVEEDQVGRFPVDDFQGLFPIACFAKRVGFGSQGIAKHGTAIQVVVND